MKWPNSVPKTLWILLDHDDHLVGFAFDDEGFTAFHRYANVKRAVRFDRATTDAQEEDYIASHALKQLNLFEDP